MIGSLNLNLPFNCNLAIRLYDILKTKEDGTIS